MEILGEAEEVETKRRQKKSIEDRSIIRAGERILLSLSIALVCRLISRKMASNLIYNTASSYTLHGTRQRRTLIIFEAASATATQTQRKRSRHCSLHGLTHKSPIETNYRVNRELLPDSPFIRQNGCILLVYRANLKSLPPTTKKRLQ